MEKKDILDNRQTESERIQKNESIPFLGGRPDRDTVISAEDIINLKINLNISKTIEEFLKFI